MDRPDLGDQPIRFPEEYNVLPNERLEIGVGSVFVFLGKGCCPLRLAGSENSPCKACKKDFVLSFIALQS